MTDNNEHDLNDGFPERRRPPRDVIPPTPPAPNDPPLPNGPTTVVSYDITADGITRTEEQAFIGRPIMPTDPDADDNAPGECPPRT